MREDPEGLRPVIYIDERGEWEIDQFGRRIRLPDTSDMFAPVRCSHCGRVYDMGAVTITSRWTDCSVWKAPCCGQVVDDRPGGGGIMGKSRGDFERIPRR